MVSIIKVYYIRFPASNLETDFKEKKSDAIPAALYVYALEAVATRYPSDTWLCIYTDGSSQKDASARAGYYCDCENIFEGSCAVGLGATNFEAEIETVSQALSLLIHLDTSYRHAVFLVDSQSAIHSLCFLGNNDSRRAEKTKLK